MPKSSVGKIFEYFVLAGIESQKGLLPFTVDGGGGSCPDDGEGGRQT